MKAIGITGSIGSGKTTFCQIFYHAWNIPTYYADVRAKWFMENDCQTQQTLLNIFGPGAYYGKKLNTKYIADQIFNNLDLKKQWEKYIHKKVMDDYLLWRQQQKVAYHLHESALIFEIGAERFFDGIVLIVSPEPIKQQRLIAKGLSLEDIEQRRKHQLPDKDKFSLVQFVVYNDEQQSLIEQAANIHQIIISQL
ncbi:MAG: dephospho-CoA kinase [Bacteroidales bacterium]|nr:dephospho-CoA kinase [Bacteroidales bacterium]